MDHDRVAVCRRLVLPPTQELHLASVVLSQGRYVEDPGGLGVLHHHHVAVGLVHLYGHTEVVSGFVFVSYLKRRLHRSPLVPSPISTQLQRIFEVEAPGS
jgi:hypothetical protein